MSTPLRILLAPDKFKGSLSAEEVCNALARGINASFASSLHLTRKKVELKMLPLADGGDGTLDVLSTYLNLNEIKVDTLDPIGRPIQAIYLADQKRAFIEVASASGLVLLDEADRNPMNTSTYGTGLMIKDALERGKREIYLLLGGSATNDMGLGIASALGIQFNGADKVAISGSDLEKISGINKNSFIDVTNVNFILFCDVKNPVYGPAGAAHVYAKQKGANKEEIELLDSGLRHATQVLQQHSSVYLATIEGGGAAGGIGIGMVSLFGAQLKSGFESIAKLTNLERHLNWADVVVTGEGQFDSQSLQGKVVGNILEHCQEYEKPCHIVVGHNAFAKTHRLPEGITSISALTEIEPDEKICMRESARLVEEVAERLAFKL